MNYKKLTQEMTAQEKYIASQYRVALNQTRAKLALVYEKHTINGVLTYAEMAKYNRLTALEKSMMGYFTSKNIGVVSSLRTLPRKTLDTMFKDFAYQFDTKYTIRLSWALIPEKAVQDIVSNPLDKIARDSLNTKQRDRIHRTLTQGFLQGQGYPEMAKGIKEAYGKTTYDAYRVARTEGQRSAVAAQRAVYDQSVALGVKTNLFWDSYESSSRTRPNHKLMNNVKAVMHEGTLLFHYVTGQWVTGPFSTNLPASEVIHCRCRIREELVEIPEDIETGIPKTSSLEWGKESKL